MKDGIFVISIEIGLDNSGYLDLMVSYHYEFTKYPHLKAKSVDQLVQVISYKFQSYQKRTRSFKLS